MFVSLRQSRLLYLPALLVMAVAPATADGGWMGFRNDTRTTLIIQESVAVGTTSRPAKPQKIYSDETIRDHPSISKAQRRFSIADAAHPDTVLYSGTFPCPPANENVLFVIKLSKRGKLAIEAIRTPTGISRARPKR